MKEALLWEQRTSKVVLCGVKMRLVEREGFFLLRVFDEVR